MKKYLAILVIATICFGALRLWRSAYHPKNASKTIPEESIQQQTQPEKNKSPTLATKDTSTHKIFQWRSPLDRAKERVTKKYFGIFIAPANSPVQPEKFRGYHTGTDFEIFPEELDEIVAVHAICDGKLILKKSASGYGGVAVQSCSLDDLPVTVIYGHLKLTSVMNNIGDDLKAGETIGQLGIAYSIETSGERKHLHLGIHKSHAINILGYVRTKSALTDWIDPCSLICD